MKTLETLGRLVCARKNRIRKARRGRQMRGRRAALEQLEDRRLLATWYVDDTAGGGNSGLDWANAYTDLQSALTVAVSGDQIHVAQGTYKPSVLVDVTDPRSAAFRMKNGVALFGGFADGGGTRDPWTYASILSGDIGTPDVATDNAYHVFYHPTGTNLDSTAVLDGFTVTAGRAIRKVVGPDMYGAGMYNDSSSPTITNCIFSGNVAYKGAGMYNVNSSPAVTNCIFSGNGVGGAAGEGGAMYNASSLPTVTNCVFSGNSAQFRGGGMYNVNSSATVTNCIFWANTAPIGPQISGSANVTYSDVQGGYTGTGNFNLDPLFVDPDGPDGIYGTLDDDLRLQPGSPCIGAGNDGAPIGLYYVPNVTSNNAAVAADEGSTATNTGTFSDGDGNATVSLSASIGVVTKDDEQGVWTWTLAVADGPAGPITVIVTATDDTGAAAQTTFTYAVDNVPPSISLSGATTVLEGASYTLNLGVVTDPGQDTITSYSIDWGDGTTDAFTGNPANTTAIHIYDDGPATQTYNVNVTDEDGTFLGGSLSVQVLNVAPAFEAGEDETIPPQQLGAFSRIGITINDPGIPEAFSGTVNFGDGSDGLPLVIDPDTRQFDLSHTFPNTSAAPPMATYTVFVTVDDGDGGVQTDSFDVTVNLNTPPVAVDDTPSTDEDQSVTFDALANDTDNENNIVASQTVNLTSPAAGTLTNHGDGRFTFNPGAAFQSLAAGQVTTVTFTYRVFDDAGEYADGTVTVTINGVNDHPTVATDHASVTVQEGQTAGNSGTWSDIDASDVVTLSASLGLVTRDADGTWSWSLDDTDGPAESQLVTITATDSDGATSTTSFELTVTNVAPTATLLVNGGITCGTAAIASLTNPFDPSSADTSAGFHYAFSLNTDTTGSATFANSDSNNAVDFGVLDAGTYTVYARIIDKDDGSTLYVQTLLVNKADAAINITPYTGVYDGQAHGISGTAQGVEPTAADLYSLLDLGTTFTNVPGGTVGWTFAGNNNYNAAGGSAAVTITKADATVTVTPYDVTYDGTEHTATGTATGVLGEALAGLHLSGTVHTNAGTYIDDPWTFSDVTGNYNNANGTVVDVIAKAEAVITITPYTGIYDGAAHGISGNAVGVEAIPADLNSLLDLGVAFTDVPGGVANWNFAGNKNYNAANGSAAVTISQAKAIITVTPYNVTYDGTEHTANGTAIGVLGEQLAGLKLNTAHTNAGTYLKDTWTFTDFTGNYKNASGTVVDKIAKASSTTVVTIVGGPFTYDGAAQTPATVTVTVAGGLSLSPDAEYANNVNAGTGTASYSYAGDANHFGSSDSQDFAIDKASSTTVVTIVGGPFTYDGTAQTPATVTVTGAGGLSLSPDAEATYTGFVGGDNAGSLGGALTFATPATISSPVGVYPVTPGGLTSTNYAIDFVPGTLTVTIVNGSAYVLNRTVSGALSLSGNAVLNAAGDVVVDSSSPSAVKATGESQLTAAQVLVVGGVSTSGSASVIKTGTPGDVGDPLASLVAPTGGGSGVSVKLSGHAVQTIDAGVYREIKVSGDASLTLNPGVYFIAGGGISVTGNGSLQGDGVMIYNANSGTTYGGIALTGKGSVQLSAPTSGPYAGIAIFQARDNSRAMSISGDSVGAITGTIYAPAALLSISGNGALQSQATYVVDRLQVSRNGSSSLASDGSVTVMEGLAGELLGADLFLYVDNSAAAFSAEGLARLDESLAGLNVLLSPYNVAIMEVDDSSLANLVLDSDTTSAVGGLAEGVLGCYNSVGTITLIQGWDWYAGLDPAAIEAGQYDFQTVVTHELGHALGLGHSSVAASVMNDTLPAGMVRRALIEADLNVGGDGDGAEGLRAAPLAADAVDRALTAMLFDQGTGNARTDALPSVLRERRTLPEAVGAKTPVVFGPARENVRIGSPEADWYFAHPDSRASDEIADLTDAEFAENLDWILDL